MHGCTIKQLPDDLLAAAAQTACAINPANRPAMQFALAGFKITPVNLAVLTSKYWPPGGVRLTVGFMDTLSSALADKILLYLNAWRTRAGANVTFVRSNASPQVRISRGSGGYWSYLGTDILHIPMGQPTMNLEGFTLNTPDSEWRRVVVHEAGHTLGFPHEHLRAELIKRISPQKAVEYFARTNGWSQQQTVSNVLTPVSESNFAIASPRADESSIMCYSLPGQITYDGRPIIGGNDFSSTDKEYAAKIYPLAIDPPAPPPPPVDPPTPPEPPVMPSPKEIVDLLFAAVEAYFANKPIVLAIVKLAHQFVLQWLASNPQAAAAVFAQASRQEDAGEVDYARMAENLVA